MAGGAGGREVGRISIRVVPNLDGFRRKVKRELEEIERTLRGDVEITAHMNSAQARADFQRLLYGMRAQGAKGVTIDAKVERSTLDRLQSVIGGFGRSVGGGGFGRMGQFADTIAVVAAVAAVAAPALALISGALVSLPAVASAVLTPIGAVALGIEGISAASQTLGAEWQSLRSVMSNTFETRLVPIFDDLRAIFPTLEGSLPSVANGLSDVAQSIVDIVTGAPGMQDIEGTINNIGAAISASAPGIGSLTSGLLTLSERVSAKFPRLSENFNRAMDSFGGWIDEITAKGPDGISKLDVAMDSFGGTMGELLGLVKDLAKQGFDFLTDPEFGDTMKDFVADARTLVEQIGPGLKTVFEQVAGYIGVMVDGLDKFDKWEPPKWLNLDQEKAREQGQGLGAFPGLAKPDEPWFDGKVGNWLDSLEEKIENLPTTVKQNWNLMKEQFSTLFDGVGTGADMFKAQLNTLWTGITTGVNMARTQLSSIWSGLQTGWQTAQTAYNNAINSIRNQAGNVVSGVQQAFSSIPGVLSGIWNTAVSTVASIIPNMLTPFVTVGGQIISEAGTWPGRILGAIGDLGGLLVGAGTALMNGLLSGIKAGLQSVLDFASTIAGKIAAVKGPLDYDRVVLTPAGQALMEGLENGMDTGFESVLNRARTMAGEISEAMNGGFEGVNSEGLQEQLKSMLDVIDLTRKQMKVEYNAIPDEDKAARDVARNKRDQLQSIRDQLSLQREQLGFAEKYGEKEQENNDILSDQATRLIDVGKGLAETVIGAHAQDLGISGNGAISQGITQGIGFLSQMLSGLIGGGGTTIQVNSVDEAVSAQSRIAAKKALQYYR
jgi:hypothetical protein